MPSSILNTDIMYPNLSGKTTEQQVNVIMNYLYMLKEQLSYSLSNLGAENINPTSMDEIANIINEPVYVRLSDTEGNVNTLMVDVNYLSSSLSDAEGNISTLFQTSETLSSRITSLDGQVSTVTQTVSGLTSTVSTLDGEVSEISQTVNGLSFSVTNGDESSVLRLMSGNVQLSSATIQITGMVTFSDLSTSGATTINGSNIKTGVITAIDITSCSIASSNISGSVFETLLTSGGVGGEIKCYYLSNVSDTYLAGGLRLDDEGGSGDSRYRMFIYTGTVAGTPFALKLESAGSMSLESSKSVYIQAPDEITLGGVETTVNLVGTVRVNGTVIS